jgi:hypothetical protein
MSKRFLYCESTEGVMETQFVSSVHSLSLFGWMEHGNRDDDNRLSRWMDSAEVGDVQNHRLGIMVRLKDGEEK